MTDRSRDAEMVTLPLPPTAHGSDVSHPGTGANAGNLPRESWKGRCCGHSELDAPSLADTPVVGQFLGSLDALLVGVVDGVNEFTDFRASLPVAVDFLAAAGWALAVAVPLGLVALVVSYRDAQRRKAEFAGFSFQVEALSTELDEIKRHVGYPNRG